MSEKHFQFRSLNGKIREHVTGVEYRHITIGRATKILNDQHDAIADLQRQLQEARAGHVELPPLPERLHPETADLVRHFCRALAVKLYRSEKKYGYSNGWADTHWLDECREKLIEHVEKGDPIDVAAYCAFLWHHDEPTALSSGLQEARKGPFQQRVLPWMLECFGQEIASDTVERNHRFLEESLELVQACGCSASEAHQLVDYVFGRPVGERRQEVGGVMVTLAALCLAQKLDMHEAGEVELQRIWGLVEQIREKQARKPAHSPLPGATATAMEQEAGTDAK